MHVTWVVGDGSAAVGLLDLDIGGVGLDAENVVVSRVHDHGDEVAQVTIFPREKQVDGGGGRVKISGAVKNQKKRNT